MMLSPVVRKVGFALAILLLLGGFYLAGSRAGQQVFATTISPHRLLTTLNTPLISAQGPLTLADLRGNIVILYIGYTNCPDICPTTLASLRNAMDKLNEEQAKQVKVVFLSVDPQRDTPEKLNGYATAFNPTFIGVNTLNKADLDALVKEVGAFYQLGEVDENGYYPVDHSTSTIILDKEGQLMAYWQYGTEPSQLAADLKQFLRP